MKELLKKKNVKIGFAVICALVALVVMGMVVQSINRKNIISAHLEAARKYLNELDYEQAIAEYTAALSIDPNNQAIMDALERAYLEMAQIQIEMEQYKEAINILEQGYEEIQRVVLLEKRGEVELLQIQEEEERTAEKERQAEEERREQATYLENNGNSDFDILGYVTSYNTDGLNRVSQELGMKKVDTAYSESEVQNCDYSFEKEGFYWSGYENGIMDMVNKGNTNISIHGVSIGMNIEDALIAFPDMVKSNYAPENLNGVSVVESYFFYDDNDYGCLWVSIGVDHEGKVCVWEASNFWARS